MYIKNYICLFLFCSCANIVPPSGGEKDNSPPILNKSNPPNQSVNFRANKIELFFNEYIKIVDVENIRISPKCSNPPRFSKKGKTIEVSIDDLLAPNTTYTINFGKSIVDINEGNHANTLKYVFSTGNSLDSLQIMGSVKDLYIDKNKHNMLVYLALENDTLKSPYYYTFTDDYGKFKFENIKKNNYTIHAINDENNNLKYDSGELVSIPEKIGDFETSINIGVFHERGPAIKEAVNKYKNVIYFTHEPWIDTISVLNVNGVWNRKEETSSFWFEENVSHVHYQYDNLSDSVLAVNNDSVPKLQLTLQSDAERIARKDTIIIESNIPIKEINGSLFEWSNNKESVLPKLINNFEIEIPCYSQCFDLSKLTVNQSAIASFDSQENDSISFMINLDESKYGILNIVSKDFNKPLVIELFDGHNIIRKEKLRHKKSIKWIKPGNYSLRVYFDENNNYFWDPGNLEKSIKSEPIRVYPEILKIKANWELEILIDSLGINI